MPVASISDAEFVKVWRELKSPVMVARYFKQTERWVYKKRATIEKKLDLKLEANSNVPVVEVHRQAIQYKLKDGRIMIGSDPHYRPGLPPSTAHRSFVKFAKKLAPEAVVMNGDLGDFPQISRHHRIGWDTHPMLHEEIDEIAARLDEILKATKNAKHFRTIGNHDLRFDGALSNRVPQYEGVRGFSLEEQIPGWASAWTLQINDPCECVIMHRWKSSTHAPLLHVKEAGCSVVTGHLHRHSEYDHTYINNRQCYGVDAGTMAELHDGPNPSFIYTEGRPTGWRSGWWLLTFRDGKLMPPERCKVLELNKVWWRGELHEI